MGKGLLFTLLCFLSVTLCFAVHPKVTLSSNGTSAQVGSTLTLKCTVAKFSNWEEFYILFYRADVGNFFAYYTISASDQDSHRSTTFTRAITLPDTLYHVIGSNSLFEYEISLTPTKPGTHTYYCAFQQDRVNDFSENRVNITASAHLLPEARFNSSVSSVSLDRPFTVSCTFERLDLIPFNYSVAFFNHRDGELGAFRVTQGKPTILIDGEFEQIDVSPGEQTVYPTFELKLTEKSDPQDEYWCALLEQSKMVLQSNVWPNWVNLRSSKLNETQRLGSCSVNLGLNLTKSTYSVVFFSNLGPKAVNRLAEYIIRPNRIVEFKAHHLGDPWSSIKTGKDISYPTFSILATAGSSLAGGHWWCALLLGNEGTPAYRQFNSNHEHL